MIKLRFWVHKLRTFYFWIFRRRGFSSWGKDSYIKNPFRIIGKKYISIGNKVSILDRARIEVYSSGRCNKPKLIIQDNVSIEQNLHLIVRDKMIIGEHTTVSANVYIANCFHNYKEKDTDAMEQDLLHRETKIGEYCFIGYGAVLLPGAKLGKQCIVGANAVVAPGEYGDYVVLAGNPAKVIKQFNQDTTEWESLKIERLKNENIGDWC